MPAEQMNAIVDLLLFGLALGAIAVWITVLTVAVFVVWTSVVEWRERRRERALVELRDRYERRAEVELGEFEDWPVLGREPPVVFPRRRGRAG